MNAFSTTHKLTILQTCHTFSFNFQSNHAAMSNYSTLALTSLLWVIPEELQFILSPLVTDYLSSLLPFHYTDAFSCLSDFNFQHEKTYLQWVLLLKTKILLSAAMLSQHLFFFFFQYLPLIMSFHQGQTLRSEVINTFQLEHVHPFRLRTPVSEMPKI